MAKYVKYMHCTVNRYCVFAVIFLTLVFCVSCHEKMPNKRAASAPTTNVDDVDANNEEYPVSHFKKMLENQLHFL